MAIWPSLAAFCTTKNRVAVADSTPNDGEAPVVVGMADAAMHMYSAAIEDETSRIKDLIAALGG